MKSVVYHAPKTALENVYVIFELWNHLYLHWTRRCAILKTRLNPGTWQIFTIPPKTWGNASDRKSKEPMETWKAQLKLNLDTPCRTGGFLVSEFPGCQHEETCGNTERRLPFCRWLVGVPRSQHATVLRHFDCVSKFVLRHVDGVSTLWANWLVRVRFSSLIRSCCLLGAEIEPLCPILLQLKWGLWSVAYHDAHYIVFFFFQKNGNRKYKASFKETLTSTQYQPTPSLYNCCRNDVAQARTDSVCFCIVQQGTSQTYRICSVMGPTGTGMSSYIFS